MCIFCEIVKGNIPSAKVYEDEDFLAFLDISQTTKGHTLVVPKKHYDNILEMPEEEYAGLMKTAQKLAVQLKDRLHATGLNLLVNTGESAGQSVRHAHVHLIPRYDENDTIEVVFHENKLDLSEVLKEIL